MTEHALTADQLAAFDIPGELKSIEPLKRGHINETFISTWEEPGAMANSPGSGHRRRYIHQIVNGSIFRDLPLLMGNIELVTNHLKACNEPTLTLVPLADGKGTWRPMGNDGLRTYHFVEGSTALDFPRHEADAELAARAFGRFDRLLSNIDLSKLGSPIPNFQNSAWRFQQLEDAIAEDRAGRVKEAAAEISFARNNCRVSDRITDALNTGLIPLRATHADPKINNCLLDSTYTKVLCIADLDTCMPGSILFDFGDLARNTAVLCPEDEPDLTKVKLDSKLFSAVVRGFLAEFGQELTEAELRLLPLSAGWLALTLGVRFLADFLNGDVYFKVKHPGHNLQRARTQLRLAENIIGLESELNQLFTRSMQTSSAA